MVMNINDLLGVEPDNIRKRVVVGTIVAVTGIIFVMSAIMYNLQSIGSKILYTHADLAESISGSQNTMILLVFLYVLFLSSDLYYIFLPWKKGEIS